jgi:helix-turn-helix protein
MPSAENSMTDSVVADFPGWFYTHEVSDEPPKGRILLSQDQLVVASDDFQENIATTDIFDVKTGDVPERLRAYFNDTVTIGYKTDETRRVVAIEGEDKHVDRFATVLFKVLLNWTATLVRHPARRGGRVTDVKPVTAKLDLQWGEIGFLSSDRDRVAVDLDDVINVDRSERDLGAGTHPVVKFRHLADDNSVTTEVGIKSDRKTNLLGRYIRTRYSDLAEALTELTISQKEEEILVALYSTDDITLTDVVNLSPQRLTMVVRSLREKELVADADDNLTLTMKGKIVATNRLEDVNR